MERKLAAIFSADVQGYSRLMGDDEEATIRTLTAYRTVMTNLIQQHRGRVVDSPGDNLLAEFASAVDAAQGAVAIQKELQTRNAELPAHRQMLYRIGINVGDVVVEGERIYGDGVNIAARLESLADGGGISISGTVYDQIANKLAFSYEYQGEQSVKNIAKPVRVYRVVMEPAHAVGHKVPSPRAGEGQGEGVAKQVTHAESEGQSAKSEARGAGLARQKWARMAVAGLLLLAGVIVTVRYFSLPFFTLHSSLSTEEAKPPLSLPDKPSIAILPFTNMSNDPEQEYFNDGMTEDLITDLSKISGLFVISRNSVFTYKGKAVNVEQVGREMGVRYVLEGSARKAGDRVRITAQLIDATNGGHLWAERYDREFKDVFALQDEITQELIRALRVEVQEAEQARVRRIPTQNLTAYDSWLRGVEYWWRTTNDDNIYARKLFERAIEIDPQYAKAYAWLGWTYWLEWNWKVDAQLFERAKEYAQRALMLDDTLPDAHILLGHVYMWHQKQPDQAIAEGERAIALDPNHAVAHVMLADILNNVGQPEEAIRLLQQAMRLDPRYQAYYPLQLAWGYTLIGKYEEALSAVQEALRLNPNDPNIYTLLSTTHLWQWIGQRSQDLQTLARAVKASQQSVTLSPGVDWTHRTLSASYLWQKQYDEALAEAEQAVMLNPTETQTQANFGSVLNSVGRPAEILQRMEPDNCSTSLYGPYFCLSVLGEAYYLAQRYEEAISFFQQALTSRSLWIQGLEVHLGLAASYSELGRTEEAQAAIAEVLKINPQFSLAGVQQRWPYKDPALLERFVTDLRKAGLK